jgi:NAD(P)-dependent dehydrogenase (short-subunit alcohol dehydrogenase family)
VRVAAITGGRGAIGSALVGRLRDDGWTTVAMDLPGTQPDVALDTTDTSSVEAAFKEVANRFGRLDLLVIAAGVTALGTLEDTDEATFRRLMDINFHGAVACLRAARPALGDARGHVAVLSSVAGFAPVIGRPAYVASKHALTGTFEALRPELAAEGIGVTLVHPTFVANELADAGGSGTARSTTGRLVTPEDVAQEVVAAAAKRTERVLPGRTAWLAYHAHRLAPRLYRRLMTRRLNR